MTKSKAFESSGLTLKKIERTIAVHIRKSGGIRPAAGAGLIAHGEFANKITWYAINAHLIRHARRHEDCGFTSLSSFIDKLEKEGRLPESRHSENKGSPGRPRTPLDITNIVSIMRQTLATGRKILPADKIEITGLWHGKYWASINHRLPEFGFADLKALMEKFGIKNKPTGSELPEIRPRTANEILELAQAHIETTNHLPPVRSGLLRNEFARASVSLINKDLRNGKIEGLSEIFGDKAQPVTLESFLIDAGLAKSIGGMLKLVKTLRPHPD